MRIALGVGAATYVASEAERAGPWSRLGRDHGLPVLGAASRWSAVGRRTYDSAL
jgi:hypothetical protein